MSRDPEPTVADRLAEQNDLLRKILDELRQQRRHQTVTIDYAAPSPEAVRQLRGAIARQARAEGRTGHHLT